ncbi:MAG: hypothetical protein IT376_21220 [Polyangiaceae bacterium]|nr:hypothetical protein [Polyangiaceae bacterium]
MSRDRAPTFVGITTYFAPGGSAIRLENFRRFREHSRRQGLHLVAVELAFGEEPFVLRPGEDGEALVQRRSTSVLWQKERLLNLALEHLPASCRAVGWLDADVLFEDDTWIARAEAALERWVILQPFRAVVRLPRDTPPGALPGHEVGRRIRRGTETGTYVEPLCKTLRGLLPTFRGTVGYAWCARRSLLDTAGFYDRCIVGGGDRELAVAFAYPPGKAPRRNLKIHHPALRAHLIPWQRRVHAEVRGRFGHLDGVVHHLWHGDQEGRRYADRQRILEQHDFDPERDLTLDAQGCWAWTGRNPSLELAVRDYFAGRATAASA